MAYIYVGGDTDNVWQIDPADMSKVAESPDYGGRVIGLASDDNYIYMGGSEVSSPKIWQISPADMSKVAESIAYGNISDTIHAITTLGGYVYAGGGDGTNTKVWKLDPSDMSKVGESAEYGGLIVALTSYGDNVWVGGAATKKVWRLNASNLVKAAESEEYPGTIYGLVYLGGYIYAVGAGLSGTRKLWKLNYYTLSKVAESDAYGGTISGLTTYGGYIYMGGWTTQKVWKINPSDMSKVGESADYGGVIRSLTAVDGFIYVAGYTQKVAKLRASDLVQVDEIDRGVESYVYGAIAVQTIPGLATVTTQLCTDIDDVSGTGNGNVTDLGDSAVTQHGHCWSESNNPTTSDSKTTLGAKAATGAFTSAITGLDASTTYYVRAYATNSYGTVYGVEVELITFAVDAPTVTTQECTAIQATTATGNGTLIDIGGSDVTQHGHVWATVENPTTANDKTTLGERGVGVFESSLISLDSGQVYYVRAYATNTQGTAYGDNVTLTTPTDNIPVVTTQACSAIAPESATGHGNITSFGDDTPSQHGHCWSTSQNPTLSDEHTNEGIPIGTGAFDSSITGLTPNTRYYIRAYATNIYGTAYGNQVSIFTYPGGAVINPENPVGVDWADDGNYVDISDDIMEAYVEYGKARELNEATPSLLTLTVDNYDHKYSPPNASSPYNIGGNTVRAGHRIRFSFAYPFDDFEDVDGTLIANHIIPKDNQYSWTLESGTFSIFQGKLRETGGSGGIAVVDFEEADAHIQVDFTKGANNDGIIVFRFSDTNNFLYVRTDGTNLEVRKVDGGSDTLVAEETLAWANAATKTIKVILHGAYIYVVADNALIVKTSSTHNQTETEHGVGGASIHANARWNDFGGIYSLFYGTIDRIIPYPNKERQTCLIEASDDLKILQRHILYRRAYAYTGYPGGMRAFIQEVYKNTANVSQLGEIMDVGETISTSPYKSWWGISGLKVCRNVEREENGFFYQDQESFWRFEAKGHRAAAPHDASRCIFYQDYDTNNLAFTGFKWISGEDDVVNMVSVHVQKSVGDSLNLATGGQEVWRCADADVLDGGIAASQLVIAAESSVVIYFESKNFETLEDLITPATASAVYKVEGKITDGPFLLGETVTGSVSTNTGKVLKQGGGYIILGDCTGAFNAADIWVGATSEATIAIGYKIEGTIAGGPFLWGEGITTDVSGDTGVVRQVGTDFLVLESCSGSFNAGDTLTGATSTATMNGGVTITVVGSLAAIPDYQANADADGGGADKTANLTVTLSYPVYNSYGRGGKLTLTNDDTSAIYVTRLLVRGDGYNLQDRGSVYVEDATSKTTYGEHSLNIDAQILTSLAEAKTLADDIEAKEDYPRSKVELTLENQNKAMLVKILSLKLSDRITANYSDMGVDEDFFVNKIVYNISQGGLLVEAVLKCEQAA